MYCPNCASLVHGEVKFCTHCGLNLKTVSDLLDGRIIEPSQSEEIIKLLEKCHNGYLSTVIGLGLLIFALLIGIAGMLFGVIPAAISSLIFLGWAIPATAQGIGKWRSAKREMHSILEVRSVVKGEAQPPKNLPAEGEMTNSRRFAGSITERTTANLDQRA
jgi:hypothetical protein